MSTNKDINEMKGIAEIKHYLLERWSQEKEEDTLKLDIEEDLNLQLDLLNRNIESVKKKLTRTTNINNFKLYREIEKKYIISRDEILNKLNS